MGGLTPVDLMLAAVEWRAIPAAEHEEQRGDLPYATHEGELQFGDAILRCYQLNTGKRVIDAESVEELFDGGQA
jgi:hypothetical protein